MNSTQQKPGLRTIVRKEWEEKQRREQEQRRRSNLAAFRKIATACSKEN